jgi:lipopolysaccharide/colanic/teichoic acid biosynthesis glycosyltransferase
VTGDRTDSPQDVARRREEQLRRERSVRRIQDIGLALLALGVLLLAYAAIAAQR